MIENLPFGALRVFESAARHLSFKDAAEDFQPIGRISYLDRILHEAGYLIICFQEARPSKDHFKEIQNYWCYASGASKDGSLGCETWIAKSWPSGKEDKFIAIPSTAVSVLSTSPRHIFASLVAPPIALDIMNAHGPYHTSMAASAAKITDF